MKRMILISMLTAAAVFAQSTSAPATPNAQTKSTSAKKHKKSNKKSTGAATSTNAAAKTPQK